MSPWQKGNVNQCEHAFTANRLFKCHLMNISRMIVQYIDVSCDCVRLTTNQAHENYKLVQSQPFAYFVRVHIFYELHSIQYITYMLSYRFCTAFESIRRWACLCVLQCVIYVCERAEERQSEGKWKSCHYDICGKIGINNKCGNILLRIPCKFACILDSLNTHSRSKGTTCLLIMVVSCKVFRSLHI